LIIEREIDPAISEHRRFIESWRPEREERPLTGTEALGYGLLTAGPEFAYTSLTRPVWTTEQQKTLWTPEMYGMVRRTKTEFEEKWESGDWLGLTGQVIGAPLVSVPVAFGAGAAFTFAFKGISAASIGVKGLTGKVLGGFGRTGPWVMGGTVSGIVGAELGMTAAYEEKELVPPGTTISKAIRIGTIYTAAGMGAKYAQEWQPSPKLQRQVFAAKFRWAKVTGRGMYRPEELRSIYQPGRWKELPYSTTGIRAAVRPSKFLYTGKEAIPLETYIPVIPGPKGRIVDVGRFVSKPKMATGPGFKSGYGVPGMVYGRQDVVFKSFGFKPFVPPVPKGMPVVGGPSVTVLKTVTTGGVIKGVPYAPAIGRIGTGFRMPSGFAMAYGAVSLRTLEFLEEGIVDVHPRWDKARSIEKQITDIKSVVKIERAMDILRTPKVKQIGTVGLKFEPGVKPEVKKDLLRENVWKQEFERVSDVIPVVTPVLGQKQLQSQLQIQMLSLQQQFVTEPRVISRPKVRPRMKPTPRKPFALFPLMFPDGAGERPVKKDLGRGYYVMVKSRQYRHGKPVGREKFHILNRNRPLSYNAAKSLMGSALDHTIAQTGFLKSAGRPAMKPSKRVPSLWNQISYKFIPKKNRWMESRAYAIDTPGESKELNVFRWYQGLPQTRKVKKGREVFDVSMPGFDLHDFDRLFGRARF